MSNHLRRVLTWIWPVRIALGALFLYSALPKLQNLEASARNARDYNVLPEALATLFGYALPFGELALGLLLVLGLLTRLAALGGVLLMVSFLIAIGVNLVRGTSPAECGCFAVEGGEPLAWTDFARDVGLLAALVLPLADRERRFSLDRWIAGQPLAGGQPAGQT